MSKHVARVEAADISPPATGANRAERRRRKRAGVDEDLESLAWDELESLLSSPIATRRHQAAIAIIGRAKEDAAKKQTTPEALAEIERRQEANRRAANDPTWFWTALSIGVESGVIAPPPSNWCAPTPRPVAELIESSETTAARPEPEPAKNANIDEAEIVEPEPCACGHFLDEHAGGAGCRYCPFCHLFAVRESNRPDR